MWVLDNQTHYGGARNWIRDKDGVHHWVVAICASFDIAPEGELRRASHQAPPALVPEYSGAPGASSLRIDSDLLAKKPCTDIVLIDAHAHAPKGEPASVVPVTLRVGEIEKTLLVHGERSYAKGSDGSVNPTPAKPFLKRPISYELAYGGEDTADEDPSRHGRDGRNPVGVGFATDPQHLVDKPAPSVVYAEGDIAERGPAGFGPIDRPWSPRRELAGTYDAAWQRNRRPLLAEDYDELFASCAPADQRVTPHLRGAEVVQLENMTPEGLLRFTLPKLYFTYRTQLGGRSAEHRGRMTSVLLQPEARVVSIIWQSTLRVDAIDEARLDQTIVHEKPYLARAVPRGRPAVRGDASERRVTAK